MAAFFRVLGGLPAIALGLFTVIAWSLQKGSRGFLYVRDNRYLSFCPLTLLY